VKQIIIPQLKEMADDDHSMGNSNRSDVEREVLKKKKKGRKAIRNV